MYIHALVNAMTFLCSCCNTGGYIYIVCFVWLKVTASSIYVSLSIVQAFVFVGTLIAIGLVLDICLRIKSWHGSKCHSLSSVSYCKEYLYVRNIFIPTLPSLFVGGTVAGMSGPGSSPGQGQCVVFLGKTLYSHGAYLHPDV